MKSGISLLAIVSRALAPMTLDDAAAHREDLIRTRIEPGADPRVPACGTNWRALWYFVSKGRAIAEEPAANGTVWFDAPPVWSARTDRYVPVDVLRWRDPEHRAALTARARAHAAIIPGNRATMPVEVQS